MQQYMQIYGIRNDSTIISNKRNSTALDRFLEDVQKAQKNFQWIDHTVRHINNNSHLDSPMAGINEYIAASVNTADVPGRSDIGYKSRLRGKRSFDRNYETMWMSERNKYREDSRDVPQRVYLDNDMMFKRNADSDTLYRSHSVLDGAVYGSGTMDDQPLRDIGNKDLHSPDDWSNSNGNAEVTYREGPWIADYRPTREILINSDDDLLDHRGRIEGLYDRIYADDLIALRESSSAINNAKRQNTLSSLEGLKKTVLKLRDKLTFENIKANMISSKDETDNWNDLQSEISNFRRRDVDYDPDGEVMKLKRVKNTDENKNKDLGIFQGLTDEESYYEDHNSKKSHDRSKRSKSFVSDINNRTNLSITSISGNIAYQKPQIIKEDIQNVIEDDEESVMQLHPRYLKNNEINLMNALNKTFELKYPLNKRFSLNDHFTKSIVMPSIINEPIRKNIEYIGLNCINAPKLKKNLSTLNTSIDSICFFTNNNTDTVLADRTDGKDEAKKLEVLMRETSRFDTDDGQLKDAREEIPLGNTSRSVFGLARNELRNSTVETSTASEIKIGTRKENNKPPMIPGIMKLSMIPGNPYQKQKTQIIVKLSRQMSKDGISVETMTTNESRNANVKSETLTHSIDIIDDVTAKPEVSVSETVNEFVTDKALTPNDRHDEFNLTVLDELRKQQMLSAKSRNGNCKSNGNFAIDKTAIRSLGLNKSETTNPMKDIQIITPDVNRSVNNIRRKLLWISTISVDPESEDLSQTTTKRVIFFNNLIISASPALRVKREIITEASPMLQNTLDLLVPDINLHARYKRSTYSPEDLEFSNEADRESDAIGEDEAINHVENRRNNEEYTNENIEESMENYEDGEEDMMEGSDRLIENTREERSLSNQKIDPIKAIINTLIQQRHNHKDCSNDDYARKRRNTLDMIEYYDYDGDEQEERDTPVNELAIADNTIETKIKRDDKTQVCKLSKLGKKKNENAETAMKEERDKARANNTEPKEEIIVDLDKSKSKIIKNKKLTDSSESSFEDALNEERERLLKDTKKINIIEDTLVNIQPNELREQNRDLASAKSYEDLGNKGLEDRYYYKTNDGRMSNDTNLLYEELKKVYDWPDGELKSGPRLRGDQRLRCESDDKSDTKSPQLQSLDDGFFVSNRKDDTQTQSRHASSTIIGDMPKGGFQQTSSEKEDLLNGLSISTSTELIIFKIVEDKNNTFKDIGENENTIEQSAIDMKNSIETDSGSYENRKYLETDNELRQMLKQDLKPEKQTVIKSQDLYESFVEPLNWHDDFDDNVRARFGRGLKTIDEALISDSNKSNDQISRNIEQVLVQRELVSRKTSPEMIFLANLTDKVPSKNSKDFYLGNKSIINTTNINFPSNFHHDSSILQHNTTLDVMNIFNMHRDAIDKSTEKFQESSSMNGIILNITGDLEAAEQKYINYQIPQITRAATSYRTYYDDIDQDQHDSDEADISSDNHLQFPHILANQPDKRYYSYVNPIWNTDIRDNLNDGYSKISRSVGPRKKENFVHRKKKNKQSVSISKTHTRKNNSHISLNNERNRRHHALQTVNSKDINSGDREMKKKKKNNNKTVTSSATKTTGSRQKSKMADRESLLEGITKSSGEKVFYENAEDQSTVKSEENDTRKKEITSLLAIDNIEDESQIDMALHGELAGKIIEQIFEQVQKNSKLKNVIGPGLHRNYKMEDIKADEIYRQGLAANATNHTETLVKRVTELLDKLILDEIQRKTCISLSPDMREFLGWILEVDREEESLDEAPPLPAIRKEVIPDEGSSGKFLFHTISKLKDEKSIQDLQKKVRIMETLVDDYNTLTAQEKTKVQTDHNYLVGQLNGLLRDIEALETAQRERKSVSMYSGATRPTANENILRYQSAVPNVTNANYSTIREAFFSPIDTHRLSSFDNTRFKLVDGPSRDAYVSSHHRGIRSLDDVPSKQRRRKKQQHRKKNNKGKRKQRKYQNHTRSSKFKMLRRKRANLEDSNQSSLYFMYEEPTIYDSFDILNARLTKRKQTRKMKRELADKKNDENDRMLDSLPIKGKNRLEDEVILLNKREAWKRENKEQLEAVAFGKDMRNGTTRERERFEKLTKGDKRRSIDNMSFRMKREGINLETSTIMDHLNDSRSAFVEINNNGESQRYLESKDSSEDMANERKLKLLEKSINVYADNKTDVIDTEADGRATREISTGKKLVINAGTDNRVREELRTTNYERKIDNANNSTSVVNLTNSSESPVSEERRKVFAMEKETDDKVVKLNPGTNYRDDETDLEAELKNLRDERRNKRISNVIDWRTVPMTNPIYKDDNLPGNRSREAHYTFKLDELGDLDINLENNSDFRRLRKNRQISDDIIGWRMMPIIRRSVYVSPLSEVILDGKKMSVTNDIKNINLDTGNVYSSNPTDTQRLKHHRRKNWVIDISPIYRIIGKHRRFRKRNHGRENRLSNATSLKNVNPKTLRKSRKLSRLRSNQESNGVTEFEITSVSKKSNRELRKRPRYIDDQESDDPTIYDEIRSRPIWLYQYYDDFTDLPIFHDIVERNGEIYRYPTYLEYGPFKERTRDLNRISAKWNGLRSTILGEAVNFPRDNLTNSSSEYGFARGKFHEKMEMSSVATREDNLETKCTRRNKSNNTV